MGVLQQSKIAFPNKQVKLDVVSCMALNFDYGLASKEVQAVAITKIS